MWEEGLLKTSSWHEIHETKGRMPSKARPALNWQSLMCCKATLLATWDRKMQWPNRLQAHFPQSFKALVFRPLTSIKYSEWGQSWTWQLDWGKGELRGPDSVHGKDANILNVVLEKAHEALASSFFDFDKTNNYLTIKVLFFHYGLLKCKTIIMNENLHIWSYLILSPRVNGY